MAGLTEDPRDREREPPDASDAGNGDGDNNDVGGGDSEVRKPIAPEPRQEPRRADEPAGSPAKRAHLVRLAALGIAAFLLFPLLGKSGIWDPYELDAAELARRIAIHVWGARDLEIPGSLNSLPTLTDLRMGELPFTSMALGFKVLGLHDWTGRLPLAIWGFAGAAVLYELLARLIDKKAGLYAVAALVTMPLYFMQARTMLGDIVTMSALVMAFSGLAGAMLDARAGARIAWAGVGAVGLAAGFFARGVLLGVAVPSLSIGLTWLVIRASGGGGGNESANNTGAPASARGKSALGAQAGGLSLSRDIVGVLALLLGVAAVVWGARVLSRTTAEMPLSRVLGVALLRKAPTEATFDLPIRQLGHALFPWSAFLPFAIGRLFRAPVEAEAGARDRETAVRLALLIGASTAFAAVALLARHAGSLPYTAPALLAAVAGVAIYDLERGAPPSRATALGTLLLTFVLYRDISLQPEKALAAFVVDRPTFPKSFEPQALLLMRVAAILFAGIAALSWFEAQPKDLPTSIADWARRRTDEYRATLAELAKAWNGNLLFTGVVIEAALIGLGGMLFFGKRLGWGTVDRLPKYFIGYGLNLWWAVPLVVGLALPVFHAVRDTFRTATHRARAPRAAGTLLAALLAGGALSLIYYPALAAQLSPKEVFDEYAKLRGPGEPLALLGVRSRAAAYYQGGGEVESFSDVGRAFAWLTAQENERRWLIVKADDLPKLNSTHRKAFGKNVPVLDGRSSQIMLVSNKLGDGPNQNPVADVVLDAAPAPAHPLDILFEDQLEALGWEVTDAKGRVQEDVVPQTKYHLRTYYRVLRPVTGTWKVFVHIDGFQRRYNGDHAVLDGRYPMALWQPGDIIVDDHEFQLEPNFGPGDYTVYFGFFTGETRFKVTRGSHNDNRVIGGALRVR